MSTGDLLKNPYVCGHPVSGKEFFGRRDELSRLVSQIERGGHYCILGPAKVGKTSLLQALAKSELGDNYLFCYCRLRSDGTSLGEEIESALRTALRERARRQEGSATGLQSVLEAVDRMDPEGTVRKAAGQAFGRLFEGVKKALDLPQTPTESDPEGLAQLRRTLAKLKAQELRPVVLLDDAERLLQARPEEPGYRRSLESIFDERLASFALTLGLRHRDLVLNLPETLRMRLGALAGSEARTLFVAPAAALEVNFSDEWVEAGLKYVGTHPYLVQTYAFHLFSRLQSEQPERQRLEREVREACGPILEDTLQELAPGEAQWLRTHWADPTAARGEESLVLKTLGLLDPEGQLVPLWGDFLKRRWDKPAPEVGVDRPAIEPSGERSLLEVIEERMRLDTYLRERFTHVATFVDIDVVGSTQLKVGEDEFGVIYSFEEFHKWQKEKIEGGGGRLLNAIGDETMSMFDEPEQALLVLREMLDDLPRFNASERNRLKGDFTFRAGVHLGEVIRDTTIEKAYSHVLDLAGHLQKLAPNGSVAVSQLVYEALGKPDYLEPWQFAERDGIMTFRLKA